MGSLSCHWAVGLGVWLEYLRRRCASVVDARNSDAEVNPKEMGACRWALEGGRGSDGSCTGGGRGGIEEKLGLWNFGGR